MRPTDNLGSPSLLFEKIKAGVFDGTQIRVLVRDQDLMRIMNDKERGTRFSFVAVMESVLANKKPTTMKPLKQICCQLFMT